MTFKYNNVYINDISTIAGPLEMKGPLSEKFDKGYKDFYFGAKTWEQAESKILIESVEILLNKLKLSKSDIDLHISGDLLNQIVATNYASSKLMIPLIGVYSACATSMLSIIIGSNMIDASQIQNCIISTSSHNNGSEKQFRQPVEYGGPKKKTTTFTVTGAASAYLSNKKKFIKVESGTLGSVIDMDIKDSSHMGAVMAPAAARTIFEHLKDLNRDINYYDLILTGDLGIYGKKILKEYMKVEYGIILENYDDSACMIYNIGQQKVYAGGSGPACMPLVAYSYIFDKMRKGELKKVLLVATGSLHSQTVVNQKLSIPAIAHAVSLEVYNDIS